MINIYLHLSGSTKVKVEISNIIERCISLIEKEVSSLEKKKASLERFECEKIVDYVRTLMSIEKDRAQRKDDEIPANTIDLENEIIKQAERIREERSAKTP